MASFNHFNQIADLIVSKVEDALPELAEAGAINVQEMISANGQVDTGNMLDSVHVEQGEGKDQLIVVGADYGADQNYGTRYLPPRPFFEPGIQNTQDALNEALQTIANDLGSNFS